jgi:Concanavalin A-like lectin/glucanases superfamily
MRIRLLPRVVRCGRRAVPGALVLALIAAASAASTAVAASSAHSQVRPKDRFRPRIIGQPKVGVALRATRGIWTPSRPGAYEYRWLRCPADRARCRRIAGASRRRYTPSSRDVGTTLRVMVTARNAAGSGRATSRRTRVVPASGSGGGVLPAPPAVASSPTVSGTAQAGQTLTASPGIWTGTAPIAYGYQWQSCDSTGSKCNAITGATSMTYTSTSTDVGHTLEVSVTASNMAGNATAFSAPTGVVVSASGPPRGLVALWHMDETTGTTMFDSVAAHNGTLHSVQLGGAGSSGTAYGFNGSSSYVDVLSAVDLNPGSANISFTIHVKTSGTPPAAPADWDLIRKGLSTTAGGEYKMELQQTGRVSCGFKGTAGQADMVAGPAINDGHWHSVSCMRTSSAIKLAVDGQVFSKAANVGSIANTSHVVIGARPGSDWYKGQLDEASIHIG